MMTVSRDYFKSVDESGPRLPCLRYPKKKTLQCFPQMLAYNSPISSPSKELIHIIPSQQHV